jgi:hypothetical protein
MKPKMLHRKRGFLQGFLRGLNSCSEIFRSRPARDEQRLADDGMRRDWQSIGNDFRAVMPPHEYGATSPNDG